MSFRQNGEIGLDRVVVLEFALKDVLLNEVNLLIKLERYQEWLATMPNEVDFLNRQFTDATFDIFEGAPHLIQAHPRPVAEVRKFVAIVTTQIAVLGNLEHKLWRRAYGHRRPLRQNR